MSSYATDVVNPEIRLTPGQRGISITTIITITVTVTIATVRPCRTVPIYCFIFSLSTSVNSILLMIFSRRTKGIPISCYLLLSVYKYCIDCILFFLCYRCPRRIRSSSHGSLTIETVMLKRQEEEEDHCQRNTSATIYTRL